VIVRAAGGTIAAGVVRNCGANEEQKGRLDNKKVRKLDLGDVCLKVWDMTRAGENILAQRIAECSIQGSEMLGGGFLQAKGAALYAIEPPSWFSFDDGILLEVSVQC